MSGIQSINYQHQVINEFAEEHDITIIQRYHDGDCSGRNASHHVLQRMLMDVRSNDRPVDYLLFYSVDQLGRDFEGNLGIVTEISDYVDTVYSVLEQFTFRS